MRSFDMDLTVEGNIGDCPNCERLTGELEKLRELAHDLTCQLGDYEEWWPAGRPPGKVEDATEALVAVLQKPARDKWAARLAEMEATDGE